MPIGKAHALLTDAAAGGYGLGAFNVTNLVQMKAAVEAAVETRSPLILQTSVTTVRFLGPEVLVAIFRALAAESDIPLCLHLDHCTDVAFCKACVDAGYTGVMIDASRLPFDDNIEATREVCRYAHAAGDVSVEGELGTVSGTEDQIRVLEDEALLCDPGSAGEFVERTGVDLFAPSIGTAHGVYATADPRIDFDRLARIAQILRERPAADGAPRGEAPRERDHEVPLVIHGGSGLPDPTVKRLIELGGAKFNVSTDLKQALVSATAGYLRSHRGEYKPLKIDEEVREAVKECVLRWMRVLGSGGRA